MRKFWIEIRSSLWFVPAVLVLTAAVLGGGLVDLDVRFADQLKPWGWLPFLNAGAEGARGMLTAIASSMITVAGVAFSITIVALSLASTQYTPRILRNFMRDRANQSVLGVFVGIYTYCLIVLRTIRGGSEAGGFVPLLSVSFGVLLAMLGIGYLIFFIHHIATSIQASSILDAITTETFAAIDKRFPEELGESVESETAEPAPREGPWQPITSIARGYIQSVNWEGLRQLAAAEDHIFRLTCGTGDFVMAGTVIVSSQRVLDKKAIAALRRQFAIGDFRTVDQDPGFGIRQIADIALKALSPGINDTSTAVSCLDYLGAILSRLATRRMDPPGSSAEECARLLTPVPLFADSVAKSLDEIRLSAGANVTVLVQFLCVLTRVAEMTASASRKVALVTHARMIAQVADDHIQEPYDRSRVNLALDAAREALRAGEQIPPLSPRLREACTPLYEKA